MRFWFLVVCLRVWSLLPVFLLSGSWIEETLAQAEAADSSITHWAAGEVSDSSAVLWARAEREGWVHLQVAGPGGGIWKLPAVAERDFTVKLLVNSLKPYRQYRYRIWFSPQSSEVASEVKKARTGHFRTAPARDTQAAVRFAWGGDVSGQNVCRDEQLGYPLFGAVEAMRLDFFLGLGDMIYADGRCEAVGRYGNAQLPGEFGPSTSLSDFWTHWRYNLEEEHLQRLRASVPYVAVWDDHEVVNDFGPLHATRDGVYLLPVGLQAFLDYNPVPEDPKTPKRLYRTLRWGKHLELFLLDTRQYRDANGEADSERFPKSLLGREQLTWLKEQLKASDATWKVIATSVPLSIPTGFPPEKGRDGWANFDQDTGFEQELWEIVRFMREQALRNVVFITTDVHFATGFRYRPFPEDPEFEFYELVSGPMNAGLFPNSDVDPSLNPERLFFFGPEMPPSSYAEALKWMNFGMLEIESSGVLRASIRNASSKVVYELVLTPR